MHDFAVELWRLGKELRHSEAGAVLTLTASLLIVAAASWRIAATVGRVCRAAWRWLRGKKPAAEDETIEGC